ncbi:MAG TPA: HD domain-containing protein, partial [Saprospiraceae bacterium]|nr:HD domain-containing protein [Saprospiraceae bacterium]
MPIGQEISTEEREKVNNVFESFLKEIKGNMTLEDEINIRKAFDLAVDAHKFQRRKSGEPYIYHPIAVARICTIEIGLGPTAVICALLHDVVEDTE